ncbi:hypothetical protein HYU10_01455 [Candidatus Woesearchaeota archaeon]|nr:hypothetical protein [Candidatus Woesearchaeota archaeon]MBI2130414.1 hypothetical protein [Candidatus Woesearchaeota archaeon]
MAGSTRKDIETRLRKSVVSRDNYLQIPEKKKRIEKKDDSYIEDKSQN